MSIDPLAYSGGQQVFSPYAAMGNSPGMMIDPNGEMTKYAEEDNSFNEAVEAKRPILLGGGMISERIWYHKMFGVNNDVVMYAGGGGKSSGTVSDFLFMVNPGAFLPQSFTHYQAEYVYIEDKSHLPEDAEMYMNRGVDDKAYYSPSEATAYGIVGSWGFKSAAPKVQQSNGGSVGQPGTWESAIPFWGSGRSAVDHFQNGNYWRGLGYTALAISDVFLVKSIVTGIGRGAWKLGSHSWSATRKWAVKNGYAGAGEPLHHWAITQATSKKYGLEAIANQPWNLTKFGSQASHMRWAHGQMYQGIQYPFTTLLYPITSTPTWFKAAVVSGGGRIID